MGGGSLIPLHFLIWCGWLSGAPAIRFVDCGDGNSWRGVVSKVPPRRGGRSHNGGVSSGYVG